MKYDVFMRTRTYENDYTWLNKPDYMPSDMYQTCRTVIALREKDSFDSLTEDDWYGNFFYIKAGGCCLLARMAKTHYSDSFGRSIYSFEGVSVKKEHEMRLFLNIPNLINTMLPPAQSFRMRFEEEESMSDIFETEPTINPLKSADIPKEVHPILKNNAAFRNMLKFIAYTDKPAGFIFGKNAKAFANYVNLSSLGIEHVFDFDNPASVDVDENAFKNNYKPISCEYVKPAATGIEKTAVYLQIQEVGEAYRYCWQVRQLGGSDNKLRYHTEFYNFTDRVQLAKLELQKESIKSFLIDNGWKKQQVGLRFEKEIFARNAE